MHGEPRLRENKLGIVVYVRASLSDWSVMHILIENEETSEYLVTTGKWSKKPEAGKHFRASDEAVKVARREAIEKFTIVGHIPETNQFVNLDHGRGKGTSAMGGEEVNSEQSQARGEGLVIGE